jgi:hypothetical protein
MRFRRRRSAPGRRSAGCAATRPPCLSELRLHWTVRAAGLPGRPRRWRRREYRGQRSRRRPRQGAQLRRGIRLFVLSGDSLVVIVVARHISCQMSRENQRSERTPATTVTSRPINVKSGVMSVAVRRASRSRTRCLGRRSGARRHSRPCRSGRRCRRPIGEGSLTACLG